MDNLDLSNIAVIDGCFLCVVAIRKLKFNLGVIFCVTGGLSGPIPVAHFQPCYSYNLPCSYTDSG